MYYHFKSILRAIIVVCLVIMFYSTPRLKNDKDEKITRSFYEILTTPELFQDWTSYVSDHPQTPNRLPQQHQWDRSEISLVVQLMHPLGLRKSRVSNLNMSSHMPSVITCVYPLGAHL